jgi:predicted Zn-ribbon and HTH transcriptional regulator
MLSILRVLLMDWDDEYLNGYDDMAHDFNRDNVMPREDPVRGLDPMDITDAASAYFLLSDDAQDEITGSDKKSMKCLTCGYRFIGEIYDSCPKCDSFDTDEVISILDEEEDLSDQANMKCLDCGHTFVGEAYDRCPECFSSDTEHMTEENVMGIGENG